ncbi:hypothetical protein BJ986_003120 [Phycicoccus badiiscoriae]|uniref:Uncharacterized protein n=1 Tax=Pedococcus badiiscoriae TaxID=642776 RepID=A0A852WHB1_9MICO|nr:hypothetical protein [Pedococcus badiiscoriae]NYG08633.1 hypothetical protein [Pedococcus badiiscoriae]
MDPLDNLGKTAEDVTEFLVALTISEADLPHIVICRSADTDVLTFSGPYSNGLLAVLAADREQRLEGAPAGDPSMTFTVAPLYPALDIRA